MAYDPRAAQFANQLGQYQANQFNLPMLAARNQMPAAAPISSPNAGVVNYDANGSTGASIANALPQVAGATAAGAGMGGPIGAVLGFLGSALPVGGQLYQDYQARKALGTPEEQARRAQLQYEYMKGNITPEQYEMYQAPTRSPFQQAMQYPLMARTLYDLYHGGQSFEPIAAEARRQYQEETIPRMLAAGAPAGLAGMVEKNLRKGSQQLESNLAAQQAKFQQEQNLARERILPQLMQLGLSPSFENILGPQGAFAGQPQTIENKAINAVAQRLGLAPQGNLPMGSRAPQSPEYQQKVQSDPKLARIDSMLNPQQKQMLSDLMFMPMGMRKSGTPKSIALLDKLATPQDVERMHALAFSNDPQLARMAGAIKNPRYIDRLWNAYASQNIPELNKLYKKYKSHRRHSRK